MVVIQGAWGQGGIGPHTDSKIALSQPSEITCLNSAGSSFRWGEAGGHDGT